MRNAPFALRNGLGEHIAKPGPKHALRRGFEYFGIGEYGPRAGVVMPKP